MVLLVQKCLVTGKLVRGSHFFNLLAVFFPASVQTCNFSKNKKLCIKMDGRFLQPYFICQQEILICLGIRLKKFLFVNSLPFFHWQNLIPLFRRPLYTPCHKEEPSFLLLPGQFHNLLVFDTTFRRKWQKHFSFDEKYWWRTHSMINSYIFCTLYLWLAQTLVNFDLLTNLFPFEVFPFE